MNASVRNHSPIRRVVIFHLPYVVWQREEEMKKVTEKNEKLERENEAMRLNNARDNPAGRKTTPR